MPDDDLSPDGTAAAGRLILVGPAPYVTIPVAAVCIGYSVKAIRRKIGDGKWIEGREWDRGGPGGEIRISLGGFARWAESGYAEDERQDQATEGEEDAVETALYRHFDAAGVLLYVGISVNPFARTSEHVCAAPWARQVVSITVEWHLSRRAALAAELAAIRSERPQFNKAGVVRDHPC